MAAVASACRDLARARLLPVFAQPAGLPIMLPVAAVWVGGGPERGGASGARAALYAYSRPLVGDDGVTVVRCNAADCLPLYGEESSECWVRAAAQVRPEREGQETAVRSSSDA